MRRIGEQFTSAETEKDSDSLIEKRAVECNKVVQVVDATPSN